MLSRVKASDHAGDRTRVRHFASHKQEQLAKSAGSKSVKNYVRGSRSRGIASHCMSVRDATKWAAHDDAQFSDDCKDSNFPFIIAERWNELPAQVREAIIAIVEKFVEP